MSSDSVAIFGTSGAPLAPEAVTCGPLRFLNEEGSLRAISWGGIELVRAIDYPIRDAAWGTLATRTLAQRDAPVEATGTFSSSRDFETTDGSLAGHFAVTADPAGRLDLHLRLEIRRDVSLCRAGFTLLHPINGLAGQRLVVGRADGTTTETAFPTLISPSQPATEIATMSYAIGAAAVDIAMTGAAFEMEDQRNWTDASYKTYGRTVSFPAPYPLAAGEVVEQTLTLRFSGSGASGVTTAGAGALSLSSGATGARLPELAIASERDWGAAPLPPPLAGLRRLVRLDLRQPLDLPGAGFDVLPPIDLELIVSDNVAALASELTALADALAHLGLQPDHVMALPAAYLKSYQPHGVWPAGATPADAIAAARRAFPGARIGGGMLTNFTEFNRCPPDPTAVDYVTHGTSAIVHAADDRSVFQTLETLPQIFDSVAALAPGKPYRLGLLSIGMRTNPYGPGLAANIEGRRQTMTAEDPRVAALFGAAWLVGAAAATARTAVELLPLAGAGGPFAVQRDNRVTPAFHVLSHLASMQGQPRLDVATGDADVRAVAVAAGDGAAVILANCSLAAKRIACTAPGRAAQLDAATARAAAMDPDWIAHASGPFQGGTLDLPPCAIIFLALDGRPGDPA